jgi:hypothetical protein
MSAQEHAVVTYILPTTAWASVLDIVARDAPPGAVLEVHTAEMQALAQRTLDGYNRQDVTVMLSRGP